MKLEKLREIHILLWKYGVFRAGESWHAVCVLGFPTKITMPNQTFDVVHFIFTLMFIGTLLAGVFLFRNCQRLFGPDAEVPSENSSTRAYGKLHIFAIWAHAVLLTGAFTFFLH